MSTATELCVDEWAFDPAEEVRVFEAGDIDPEKFDHEAHVRAAWSYLHQYPAAVAIARFTAALRALTVRAGASGKYHETISWFFMIVIAERRAACPHGDWQCFRRANRDLFEGSVLLRRYYSKDRLESADARRHFLLPDLAPQYQMSLRTSPQPGPSR